MPTKLTYEQVKENLKSKGLTLLTKEYINTLQKLEILCPLHGQQTVTAKQIRLGGGCFDCGQEIKVAHRRLSIDFIGKEVERAGYELLSTEYKSGKHPLLMKCPKHGEFKAPYDSIKGGHGCRDCGYESVGDKKRTPFGNIKDLISKTPYILISEDRTAHDQKIDLFCKIHGNFSLGLDRIKMGQGCISCGHIHAGKKSRKTHEDFVKEISHFGYEILTTYTTSHTPIKLKCPKHGEFKTKPYSLTNGHECPGCAKSYSKAEKELFDLMKNIYSDVKKIRSKVRDEAKPHIKRFEIDIFIPSLMKGIEFDGTRWHSFEIMRKSENKRKWSDEDIRNYHEIKDAWFLSKGIQILHIKEEDWNKDKADCVKRCLEFLSK